jgi:microsomal dipeptidase-like Zn-dependent dipeptidase
MLDTETVEDFDYNDDTQINTVLSRFESFLDENQDIIFSHLTIAHIARSIFCNQVFAFPNFNEKCSTENFLPRSIIGINKAGWRLIEKCREKNILIDVKHMSYASRCQYYKYLRDNGITVPIIASHMGAAGIAFSEVKKLWAILAEFKNCYNIQVHRPQGLMDTVFSPLTINLFDEEIKFIVDTFGLIGLSLEERILGYVKGDDIYDLEYIYTEEYNNLLTGSYNIDYGFLGAVADGSTYLTVASAAYAKSDDIIDIHTKYFCNNVLRIVYAGGANAWNCICIGSDYDGLIVAIKSCKTADQFENFRLKVLYWLPIMIKTVDNYSAIFYVDESDFENDIKQKVDKIMFENGHRFFVNFLAS